MQSLESWGRYPRVAQQEVPLHWSSEPLPAVDRATVLPRGMGRSYGDLCLNDRGALLTTRRLDRFIAFDPRTGILRCEAGVSFAQVLQLTLPKGWFLPVTPGTQFVSVGGAIASDVHGKNHHWAGSLGRFVRCLELLRSNGERFLCSPEERADWFAATVGGMGLTGLITWAELQLKPVTSPFIEAESVPFDDLEGFFRASDDSDQDFEYTASWVDCLASGKRLGRGVLFRGNHAEAGIDDARRRTPRRGPRAVAVPFDAPSFLLNRFTMGTFNRLYGWVQRRRRARHVVHYGPFFYPLDRVRHWNRLYGRRGLLQFQCVVPHPVAPDVLARMLERIAQRRQGSFLAVLKRFGDQPSPGLMSFPRPGTTLALDFPNRGEETFRLLEELDQLTSDSGGAVYAAKDACMSPENFAAYYPQRDRFSTFIDPAFSSSFWRRVNPPRRRASSKSRE